MQKSLSTIKCGFIDPVFEILFSKSCLKSGVSIFEVLAGKRIKQERRDKDNLERWRQIIPKIAITDRKSQCSIPKSLIRITILISGLGIHFTFPVSVCSLHSYNYN